SSLPRRIPARGRLVASIRGRPYHDCSKAVGSQDYDTGLHPCGAHVRRDRAARSVCPLSYRERGGVRVFREMRTSSPQPSPLRGEGVAPCPRTNPGPQGMNARAHATGWAVCALLMATVAAGRAHAAPDEFYAGKTITIITSGGGAYEAYGRVFARHMPKYIPGHPTMIVQAMPGAGGARAASYLYKAAARDGTVIGGVHGAVLTAPFLNPG